MQGMNRIIPLFERGTIPILGWIVSQHNGGLTFALLIGGFLSKELKFSGVVSF